jgi:hypothetical protein
MKDGTCNGAVTKPRSPRSPNKCSRASCHLFGLRNRARQLAHQLLDLRREKRLGEKHGRSSIRQSRRAVDLEPARENDRQIRRLVAERAAERHAVTRR